MGNAFSQSFFIPKPPITEKNVSDQTSRVHLITGGYTGCGKELARILYNANAEVWIAGRSKEKADAALAHIKSTSPSSKGSLHFLQLDLANLTTIRPAVDLFLTETKGRIHVLTNNAGVMIPPSDSKSAQGHELQIATNCLGPFLLTKLLTPALRSTAASINQPGSVRATWAGSLAVDLASPGAAGLDLSPDTSEPRNLDRHRNYGQSKAGNLYLAAEAGRRELEREGVGPAAQVLHCAWNPGNLRTELQRHVPSIQQTLAGFMLYPPVYGAYTELYSALGPDVEQGSYIVPWGRKGAVRAGVQEGVAQAGRPGSLPGRFWDWCDRVTADYA